MNLIRKLYGPKQEKIIKRYDLIVATDYGNTEDDKVLPDACRRCIIRVAELVRAGAAERIAWISADILGQSVYVMNLYKFQFAAELGIDHGLVKTAEAVNTITEAENILEMFPDVRSIILVCDWRHARRALWIWRHFFKGEITIVTIDGDWNNVTHASRWCKSNLRFMAMNLAHHALLLIFGIERLRKWTHSTRLSDLIHSRTPAV